MKHFSILFSLAFVGIFPSLIAQKTISGYVFSAESAEPLQGAAVTIKGTTIGVFTDSDGSFRFHIPEDEYAVVINFVG